MLQGRTVAEIHSNYQQLQQLYHRSAVDYRAVFVDNGGLLSWGKLVALGQQCPDYIDHRRQKLQTVDPSIRGQGVRTLVFITSTKVPAWRDSRSSSHIILSSSCLPPLSPLQTRAADPDVSQQRCSFPANGCRFPPQTRLFFLEKLAVGNHSTIPFRRSPPSV
jgi:hypothetical protein